MKKSELFFLVAFAALIALSGCRSTPEQSTDSYDDAELTSTEDTGSTDSFGGSSENFYLDSGDSFSTASGSGLGEQVDQEVLGGRSSGDDVFIDPSAPAVDNTYSYRAGSDGFVPLRSGSTTYRPTYNYSGSPAPSSGGYYDSSWRSTSSSSAKASGGTYTVKKGDSLWKIARANGCTVQALADANGLDANGILKIGTKLKIPGYSSSSSSSSSSSASSGSTYTVKKGESYYTIGKKLNVNYIKLMKANGGSELLKPGQVITIP